MGHGLLHQSNTPGRIGALLARSKDSHGRGEKVGVAESNAPRDVQRVQVNLLYLEFRRGTHVAQGRGLQNLHSWVRIPPAPPSPLFMRFSANLQVRFGAKRGGLADLPHSSDLSFWLNFRFSAAIAASPRQEPCKVAQGSGTRCRGPAPGSVGR